MVLAARRGKLLGALPGESQVIQAQFSGLEEALAALQAAAEVAASDAEWQDALGVAGAALVRYAVQISPVDTGAYSGAHRYATEGKGIVLSPDPGARNPRSGAAVQDYAQYVEARFAVYGQTGEVAERLGVQAVEALADKVVGAYEHE